MSRTFALAAAVVAASVASNCKDSTPPPSRSGALVQPQSSNTKSSRPRQHARMPAADAGPVESATAIARARREAQRLTQSLLRNGIPPREVTSVADIHGHRLLQRRRHAQALVWLETGARIDPTYEPCLSNAARAAAALGRRDDARRYLAALHGLATPLGRRLLEDARRDPDLARLAPTTPAPPPAPTARSGNDRR